MGVRDRLSARVVLPSLAAFIAGAAGVAVAGIVAPDGGGVINACYQSADGTGAVRFVSKQPGDCVAGEAGVSFNQAGPQGPAGAAGPAGATGAPGPPGASAGPAQVFSATRRTASNPAGSGGWRTVVQLTSLPAGRYLVLATAGVGGPAECVIQEGADHVVARGEGGGEYWIGIPRGLFAPRREQRPVEGSLALTGSTSVAPFGRLRLLCRGYYVKPGASLVAVRLG